MNTVFDLVIFGGTGDLAMRKLLPAMYRAYLMGDIPEESRIIITTRENFEISNLKDRLAEKITEFLEKDEFDNKHWLNFSNLIYPVHLDITKQSSGWDDFAALLNENLTKVRVFYMAITPSIYDDCCENLHANKLITNNSRLVVEKPLGYNLPSSEAINDIMAKYFSEDQIYRIDHYLGKETVQNLLTLRFSNFLFENMWDSKSIDHIQISITEQVGLEGRAGFYDDVGAMRDMVQNHLLQLLCLLAIDSPNQLSSDAIRIEKIKVLQALKPLLGDDIDSSTVCGQYVSGEINNHRVSGYLDELDDFKSNTETYVALKAYIDSWRWAGVPFYLRTGKRLKKRSAYIVVQYKDLNHNVYTHMDNQLKPNQLIIKLQPEEQIQLRLNANAIGSGTNSKEPILLNLDFEKDEKQPQSSAYQRLLMDVIQGNSTLFIHRDEVSAAWQWIDPIIEHWKENQRRPELYSAGSWGPNKANEIFDETHQHWQEVN